MQLSVILPARNAELFLERAFDSVAAIPECQIFVVPHDSVDDTALVAAELTASVARASIAETIDEALAHATGQFVLCLEAHAAFVHPVPDAVLERLRTTTADAVVFQTRLEAERRPERCSTFVRSAWKGALAVVAATEPAALVNALSLAARVDWHDEVVSMRTTVSPRNPRPTLSAVAMRCADSIEALLARSGATVVRRQVLASELARLTEALPALTPRKQASLARSLEPLLASSEALLPERLRGRASRVHALAESQLQWVRRQVRTLVAQGRARAATSAPGRVLRRLARPHRP
ncbi:MAG: glycosyltransferase [Myxococcales bacterium]|nr:glycosyltransferase [Myxococcales bacterium]